MNGSGKTPIHLVLGSGGARGLTHIGAVRVLQEYGFEIRSITGCSMGALVGALYVSGHLDDYEEWVCQLTRWDVFRFLDIALLGRSGMVKGDKLMERLAGWLGGVEIQSLEIPLTVVAADIVARKEVWINNGDLLEAVRASIAVPGVFTPLVTHGRVLVDGGILNPLPIPPSGIDNSTLTVAVSLSGREVLHPFGPQPEDEPTVDEATAEEPPPDESNGDAKGPRERHQRIEGFLDSLQRFFGRERGHVEDVEEETDLREEDDSSALEADIAGAAAAEIPVNKPRAHLPHEASRPALTDVMLGMFLTMQDTIARHQLASNPPDIVIDIPCNICQSHEFHRADVLIPAGEYWARRALDQQLDR